MKSTGSQIKFDGRQFPYHRTLQRVAGGNGEAELARLLLIGMGSASELEYQIQLAHDFTFLNEQDHAKLNGKITEVKRMLTSLIQKLKADR
jgi:four helix bundle protein